MEGLDRGVVQCARISKSLHKRTVGNRCVGLGSVREGESKMAGDPSIPITGILGMVTRLLPSIQALVREKLRGPLDPAYEQQIDLMIANTQRDIQKTIDEIDEVLRICKDLGIDIHEPGVLARNAPKELNFVERFRFGRLRRRVKNLCRGFNVSVDDIIYRIACRRGIQPGVPAAQVSDPEWLQELDAKHAELSGTMLKVGDHSVAHIIDTIKEYLELCNLALSRLRK